MYKLASDRAQASRDHGRLADWIVTGPEHLTLEQQFRQTQDEVNILEARCLALPKHSEERTAMGLLKFDAQNRLSALKKQVKPHRMNLQGLPGVFMRIAREMLSKTEFQMILSVAQKTHDAEMAAAKAEAEQPETVT